VGQCNFDENVELSMGFSGNEIHPVTAFAAGGTKTSTSHQLAAISNAFSTELTDGVQSITDDTDESEEINFTIGEPLTIKVKYCKLRIAHLR